MNEVTICIGGLKLKFTRDEHGMIHKPKNEYPHIPHIIFSELRDKAANEAYICLNDDKIEYLM